MFPVGAYLAALFGAFIITSLVMPFWIRWCTRIGLVDEPGARKIHDSAIPLAGGLALLTGIAIPLIAGASVIQFGWLQTDGLEELQHGILRRGQQLLIILFGAVSMAAIGWLDDKHELPARTKFFGQVIVAIFVALSGTKITLFVHNDIFAYAITVLWIVSVTNALNFLDNMNGLCAGLGAIAAVAFGIIAVIHGQYLVAIFCLLTCGSLFAFLPFNYPKASAFLGDSGSHLIGYLLAILAILPDFHSASNPKAWAVLTPLLILGVPLLDMAWVVINRLRHGQPFYLGDTTHISHRLVKLGFSKTKAVAFVWVIGLVCAFGAVLLNR